MDDKTRERINALLDGAERIYTEENIQSRCEELASFYHYGLASRKPDDEPLIRVNKVLPRVRSAMAMLYAKYPDVMVKAEKVKDQTAGEFAESALNYLTRKYHYGREFTKELFYSRLFMFGGVKLGMSGDSPSVPCLEAVDPRAVRFDPTTERWNPAKARYQGFRFKRSLSALEESGLYDKKDLDALADKMMRNGDGKIKDTEEVWLMEHYLMDGKKRIILAVSAVALEDKYLSADDRVWIKDVDFTSVIGIPARYMAFTESPASWYPSSPVEPWLPQVKEINIFRSQKVVAAQRSNAKILYDANRLNPEQLAKLMKADPMAWGATDGPPEGVVEALKYPEVSSDVYNGEVEADNTITEIDGMGSAQMGMEADTASQSATRDAIIQNNLQLRAGDNQRAWEDHVTDVYQSILVLAQKHMNGEIWVVASNMADFAISRKEMQGDLSASISVGSMLPEDRKEDFEKSVALLQLIAPFVPNKQPLVEHCLQQYGELKNWEDVFKMPEPEPPPEVSPPLAGDSGLPPMPGQMQGPPPEIPPDMAPPTPANPQLLMELMANSAAQGGTTPLESAAAMRGSV